AHVIGDEVEDQTEVVLPESGAETLEAGVAAELRIELCVIDDVVAMTRSLARLGERRGIDMADAERLEIRHDRRGRIEVEIGGQLQAIGRKRDGRRHVMLRFARTPTRAKAGSRPRRPRWSCRLAKARRRFHLPRGWLLAARLRRHPCATAPSEDRCPRLGLLRMSRLSALARSRARGT